VSGDRAFFRQSGRRRGLKNPVYSGKWNWGAFFLAWLWLMNHGKPGLGFGLLVLDVVYPPFGLIAHVYCAIRGNDIAYDGRRFGSVAQFVAIQNAWRNWGFAAVLSAAGIAAVPLTVYGVPFAQTAYAGFRGHVVQTPPEVRLASAPVERTDSAVPPTAAVKADLPRATPAPHPAAVAAKADVPRTTPANPSALLDANPCASALSAVHAANAAHTSQAKYDASVSALHFLTKCDDKSVELQTAALALAEKAFAEHALDSGDWQTDLSASIGLYLQCDAITPDSREASDCRTMADQESRLKNQWRWQTQVQ